MNILVVNWQDLRNPHAGGAEIHLFELFSRLSARGHRVRLVCSGFEGAPAVEMVAGIEVHRSGSRNGFALVGRRAIRAELAREPADVVVDDINKLPLFVPTLTDLPVYAIVPHLFGTTAFKEIAWPLAAIVWLAERGIPRWYRRARFHAISESTRDDLVARGVASERISVVHPGVDAEHYSPAANGVRTTPARFVYIGRLKRYKGIEHLLRAMALLHRRLPEVGLDIAGSGDDRQRLEALARDLGIAAVTRFPGFVDESEKIRLLRESVANMFPSPKEGWGITVMEAAACGTPSIASDSPGLRDSVRDGVTGLLVPHGDEAALALAMERLALEPQTVARLGRAGRSHALEHGWDTAADAVEADLQQLTSGAWPPAISHS